MCFSRATTTPRSRRSASCCGLRACGRSTLAGSTPRVCWSALTAFQVELSQRYDLDFRLTVKLLPADLPK
jgi:hypothetical protein